MWLRRLTLLGAAVALLAALAPTAAAHTALDESQPGAGETVQQLNEIRLEFGAALSRDAPRSIRLQGPNGARWDTGPLRVESDRVVSVRVTERLPATGEYTVRWCAVSADRHPEAGAYKFSYAGPTNPAARAAPATGGATDCRVDSGVAGAATGWALAGLAGAAVLFLGGSAIRRQLCARD